MNYILQQLKSWQTLLLYLSALLLINYITYGIIFAKVKQDEFVLKNFLIYNYAYNSIIFLAKVIFISLIIIGGALISNYKLKTKQIIKSVTLANFIYFIRSIIVFVWAIFNWATYTKESLKAFNSKSFMAFKLDNTIFNQFLKIFNLYDIFFICALLFFITLLNNIQWKQSIKIIFSSYIPAIIIYALFVVFLTEL